MNTNTKHIGFIISILCLIFSCIQKRIAIENNTEYDADFIGKKTFVITAETSKNSYKIPYFSNSKNNLKPNDTSINRAVIVIQGAKRKAGAYYNNMTMAAQKESDQLDSLLIIAPQFLKEEDINLYTLENDFLFWSGGWRLGYLSKNTNENTRSDVMSSFTVMDSLIFRVSKYPNIKNIVLTGHSAGGQYVNRYAASSPMADYLKTKGIHILFIVNNPSSYVYMDNKRKDSITHTFSVPNSPCKDYNHYKYGLEDLPNYLETIGAKTIQERLQNRDVIYLIGENDTETESKYLDIDCEALLQGKNRFDRAFNYYKHLLDFYGTSISERQRIEKIPDVGHNSLGMFSSELGRKYTFRK